MMKHFEAIPGSIFNRSFIAINKKQRINVIVSHYAPIIRSLQSTLWVSIPTMKPEVKAKNQVKDKGKASMPQKTPYVPDTLRHAIVNVIAILWSAVAMLTQIELKVKGGRAYEKHDISHDGLKPLPQLSLPQPHNTQFPPQRQQESRPSQGPHDHSPRAPRALLP